MFTHRNNSHVNQVIVTKECLKSEYLLKFFLKQTLKKFSAKFGKSVQKVKYCISINTSRYSRASSA